MPSLKPPGICGKKKISGISGEWQTSQASQAIERFLHPKNPQTRADLHPMPGIPSGVIWLVDGKLENPLEMEVFMVNIYGKIIYKGVQCSATIDSQSHLVMPMKPQNDARVFPAWKSSISLGDM